MKEKYKILEKLAEGAIKRLRKLPKPVVRVLGPLTSGGPNGDYEENLARFKKAEQTLKDQGYNIFDYFLGNDDEAVIQSLKLPWEDVMDYYHDPILKTGLIEIGFFMPYWETSNGAKVERKHFILFNLEMRDIPEEWFEENKKLASGRF